jgi:cell wall-associated NlpC family hydrolase
MSRLQNQSSDAIVAEARTWLRTPWHHKAMVKGVGVDCAMFLIAVFSAVGLVPYFTPEDYPADWHLHRDDPRFLRYLLQYADEVESPEVGDVVMFDFGRHAAHGSIVVSTGPLVVIHAYRDDGIVVETQVDSSPLQPRLAGFYRIREA